MSIAALFHLYSQLFSTEAGWHTETDVLHVDNWQACLEGKDEMQKRGRGSKSLNICLGSPFFFIYWNINGFSLRPNVFMRSFLYVGWNFEWSSPIDSLHCEVCFFLITGHELAVSVTCRLGIHRYPQRSSSPVSRFCSRFIFHTDDLGQIFIGNACVLTTSKHSCVFLLFLFIFLV